MTGQSYRQEVSTYTQSFLAAYKQSRTALRAFALSEDMNYQFACEIAHAVIRRRFDAEYYDVLSNQLVSVEQKLVYLRQEIEELH